MILADTSIWIAHFRAANTRLQELLEAGEIVTHPFVIGELACGGLSNRNEILVLFHALPAHSAVTQEEFIHFIDSYKLSGKGIGFVDVHLLASTIMNSDFLWTIDKKLDAVAQKMKIAFR